MDLQEQVYKARFMICLRNKRLWHDILYWPIYIKHRTTCTRKIILHFRGSDYRRYLSLKWSMKAVIHLGGLQTLRSLAADYSLAFEDKGSHERKHDWWKISWRMASIGKMVHISYIVTPPEVEYHLPSSFCTGGSMLDRANHEPCFVHLFL